MILLKATLPGMTSPEERNINSKYFCVYRVCMDIIVRFRHPLGLLIYVIFLRMRAEAICLSEINRSLRLIVCVYGMDLGF